MAICQRGAASTLTEATLIIGGEGGGGVLDWVRAGTPLATAVVAAWLALIANRLLDKRRAHRDYITRLSDALREDVRLAVEAAAEYWSPSPKNKAVIEARMKMLESEVRAGALLIDEGDGSELAVEFRDAVTDFLIVVTGADFEAVKVRANSAHIRELTGKGVALRKLTARLRRQQISKPGRRKPKTVSAVR